MTACVPSIAIGVVARDRFSMYEPCLEALTSCTDLPFHLLVVIGGGDPRTVEYLSAMAARRPQMTLVTEKSLLTQAQARNAVLQRSTERFCVLLENDTIVQGNWLRPLLACMSEEGAAVVAPLILDFWTGKIHAAGGQFHESEVEGGVRLHHQIRYRGVAIDRGPTVRSPLDYPENHCILIDRQLLPSDSPFDEAEPLDVDFGLALRAWGLRRYLEPGSVVTYSAPPPLEVRDIPSFRFRWNFALWSQRNKRFMDKWGVRYDQRGKRQSYARQQLRLGAARWWPTAFNIGFANGYMVLLKRLRRSLQAG